MILKLLLGLRNNRHQVDVVKINGESRPVLGTSHPQEEDKRMAALKAWGMQTESPRKERLATIDEPLPQRMQTILSHRLPPELRQRVNSGMESLADSRMKNLPGAKERVGLVSPDTEE